MSDKKDINLADIELEDKNYTKTGTPLTEAEKLNKKNKDNESYTMEELRIEAEQLRSGDAADDQLKKNLMFEEKKISVFKLLGHLSTTHIKIIMIFATIGSLGAGVSMPLIAYVFGDMFANIITDPEQIKLMSPEEQLEIFEESLDKMQTLIYRFLWIGAIMFVCHFLNTTCWTYAGLKQTFAMKTNYFTVILKQEQGWFDAHNAFEFATKVQAQLEQVELGIGEKIGGILMTISQLLSGLIIAFVTSWKLTLVMLCISPLILACVCYSVHVLRTGIIMGRKEFEKAGGIAEEMLYNIKTVASFANFEFEMKRYNRKVDLCYQLDLGTVLRLAISNACLLFSLNCSFGVAFLYGNKLKDDGEELNNGDPLNGGNVVTVIINIAMAVISLRMIAPTLKMIQEACVASSDYFTLVERKPEINLENSTEKPPRDSILGKIEFKDISFYYPSDPNKRIILDGLNLLFEPGKKVALVGESGCGKSTTVNLIERLYETTGGVVEIDGRNIRNYDLQYLRGLIGYVQQEPVLFNRSIRDNLIFGREEYIKTLGDIDQLIQEACDDAYATEFINLLPDKFNYTVGIKGGKLSGGQKQRIAIARAILCKPKILILDEATSALDNKSEKEVQRALDHISQKNVTTVIIAHRLSTIKNADLIYAIKGGKVIEQGTHQELLEKNGYYAGLVRSQLAQDELESKEANLDPMMKRNSSMRHGSFMGSNYSAGVKDKVIAIDKDDIKINRCRLFTEFKGHKLDLVLASFGAAIAGGLNSLAGFVMSNAMITLSKRKGALRWGCVYFIAATLNGLANFLMIWKYSVLGVTLANIFRKKILKKYLELHVAYFDIDTNAPGALLTKLAIDTMQLNSIILSMIGSTFYVGMVIIVGFTLGFCFEWRLTLIILCFVPIISFAIFIRTQLRHGSGPEAIKANIEAGSILSECVVNTKTIYSFNFQKKAVEMYLDVLENIRLKFRRDAFINGLFLAVGQFAIFCAQATVFAASRYWIKHYDMNTDNMSRTICIVLTTAGGIGNGLSQVGDYKKANIAFKSLYSTIDTASLINPFKEENQNKKSAKNIKGKIEFRDVVFAYPTRPDQIILKKISFTINPGEAAALVGYSGCGKSTIIQLLERYYDVEDGKGEILIDDVNIKDYNLYELRKKIGLVSQEPILFKRNVLENVRYGKLDATDEECIEAARKANIMKFFEGDKMYQVLDDGKKDDKKGDKKDDKNDGVGKKEDPVSGGEKQRLAIARAFLKDPVILLLDEATSALDKDSEIEVQKSLDKLAGGRTSITIAHRLSTIENSDKIYVLESGKIVEQGKHEELMNLKGKYYTLHKYSDMN